MHRKNFAHIIRYLLPYVKSEKAALYVNVGDYKNVWDDLEREIPEMSDIAIKHFDDWDDTTKFANDALTGDVTGIHGFFHKNILRRFTVLIF